LRNGIETGSGCEKKARNRKLTDGGAEKVDKRRVRDVLGGFSLLVLEERIGAFVEEHFDELLIAETGGVVEGSDVVETSRVDIRAVLDEELGEVVVAVVGGFV
jgi:plasmid stabilization system protein ParE